MEALELESERLLRKRKLTLLPEVLPERRAHRTGVDAVLGDAVAENPR
ncbi:MAG TPA: hypothetical protein VGX03_07535 [Candidatus Binatia bacterium]|jgi:hypothetical protein|nr:hypothetical protein [Candidatus Binatia bacterium]